MRNAYKALYSLTLFAWIVAYALNCGFIMIRKAGKLPPGEGSSALISEKYSMEYGNGQLEMASDLFDSASVTVPRVLLFDDLIATGASASAACNLLHDAGATVVEVATLMEICSERLNGRRRLKEEAYIELHALLTFWQD